MKTLEKETSHSEQQAKSQLESIREMVKGLNSRNSDERDSASETILEDPLSVQIRSGWHTPGHDASEVEWEYEILLCTGGPACRILGDLNSHREPETARIEHQDWGTPWTEYRIDSDEEADVLRYASQFYFSE